MQERTFTEAERDTITKMAGGRLENPTQADIELYAEWTAYNALYAAEMQQEKEDHAAIVAANIDAIRQRNEQAMANMNELHAAALARLARIERGAIDE